MRIPKTSEVVARLRAGEKLPKCAMLMDGAPAEFKADGGGDAKTLKVHLKARQREPINHSYWGPIVHDFSTAKIPQKVAIDDTHGAEVGYARPSLTEYGLELEGVVIPDESNPEHESNRIAYNLKNSIPQQASIDFTGDYNIKEIPEGITATVNGKDVPGPCLVVQDWSLRAVAICKAGADPSTETTQLSIQGSEGAPAPLSITQFSAENPVEPIKGEGAPANPTEPVETPQVVDAPPVVEPQNPETPAADELAAQELENTKLALKANNEKQENLVKEIEKLTARIAALSKPSVAPIPSVPKEQVSKVNTPTTWAEALKNIKAENPHLSVDSIVQMANEKFPELREKASTFGYKERPTAKR
jgi:hypothetical protein